MPDTCLTAAAPTPGLMLQPFLLRQITLPLCVALTVAIFIFDTYTPLGIADGMLYAIPVLLTLWLSPGRSTLLVAAGVTPLVILGGYLSPHANAAISIVVANRMMALLIVWGVALLVLRRKEAEIELQRSAAILVDLHAQRDTLIREVHHRINNNLQGVLGLLWQQRLAHPELGTILDQAIAQLHTVATVFGLQSERASAEVVLCEMLQALIRSSNETSPERTPLSLELAIDKPIRVSSDEAVPIGLIVNELIMNAQNHGTGETGASCVSVRLHGDCKSAQISVRNAGALPPDFSLAERCGLGAGLHLVLALLPRDGGLLTIGQDSGEITARLSLSPPVIRRDMANTAT